MFPFPMFMPSSYRVAVSGDFDGSADYMSHTPGGAGNRRTFTLSLWLKQRTVSVNRGLFSAVTGGAGSDNNSAIVRFSSANKILIGEDISGSFTSYRLTTATFTDTTAFHHFVFAFDTPNATAGDRLKIYHDGTQITAFDTNNAITQNRDTFFDSVVPHTLGAERRGLNLYFDCLIADVHFIDGQALTPSSFADTFNKPRAYQGIYGTRGYRLDMANSGAMGSDMSGNANDWTNNGVSQSATGPS